MTTYHDIMLQERRIARGATATLTVSEVETPEDADEAFFYADYLWREDCSICQTDLFHQPAVEIEDEEITICVGCLLVNFISAPASLLTDFSGPKKHILRP